MLDLMKLVNAKPAGMPGLESLSESDLDSMLADAKALILALQKGDTAKANEIGQARGLGSVMPLIQLWAMRWRQG